MCCTRRLAATVALALSVPAVVVAQSVGPAVGQRPATPASKAPVEVRQIPVTGTGVRAGRISTIIDAPFDVVTGIVTDFSRYREFLPQMHESRVVRRRSGEVEVYFQILLFGRLGTLWSHSRYTIRRTPTLVSIEGHSLRGNVSRFDSSIEVTPVPGTQQTRVTLQVLGIPTFPLPSSLLTNQQGRWGSRGMTALRDRAERMAAAQRAVRGGGP